MRTTLERRNGFVIARAGGPTLDAGTTAGFKETLMSAAAEAGCALLVDLSSVREIDSSGLGALVAVLKAARRSGGTVRLCGAQIHVREVITLTMIDRVLPLYESIEDAMLAAVGV